MKKTILLFVFLMVLCGCQTSKQNTEQLSLTGKTVELDNNGNVDIDITNTDFLAKGFNYGDSVNVELENGYKLEDIPFLSGMYVEYGKPMVYGKASKDKVSFIQKYKSFSENSNAEVDMTYTITLNSVGKYSYIEEVGCLSMSNDYSDFNDDEVFANFRQVAVGNIKQGRLFRSSSPIDDNISRSSYVGSLALDNNVKTMLNVTDSKQDYDELVSTLDGPSKQLVDNAVTILASISNDYQKDKTIETLIEGFRELSNSDGPYLIYCSEGTSRVGYTMAIIEGLCGASYQEIVDDFMMSYKNLYKVDKQSELIKYDYIKQINIDAMLSFITGNGDLENVDYVACTRKFLIDHGMSEDELNKFVDKLCK